MAAAALYLENLEDYMQDQQRVVTYKWLSRQLGVPVNLSKQMLFSYFQRHSSSSGSPTKCCATFLLGGKTKSAEGLRTVFKVVPEDQLEVSRGLFDEISTEHIYSLQQSPIKDTSSTLYTADYDRQQESIGESNRWSAIRCSTIKRTVVAQTATSAPIDVGLSVDHAADAGTVSLPPPTKNKPEISSASFFGTKKKVGKGKSGKPVVAKKPGSSISSILSKQAKSNPATVRKPQQDQQQKQMQEEVPKQNRKRVILSSDEEESGDEESKSIPKASQAVKGVPRKKTTPVSPPTSEPPSPKKQPKKEDVRAATAPTTDKATPDKLMKRKANEEPTATAVGPSLDDQIAAIPKTKTVQKQVKKHFQNGTYMATEIVTEDVEVERTEQEMQAEVLKIKRRFEAGNSSSKKAKITGGKNGGRLKQKQGSLMGFFTKK